MLLLLELRKNNKIIGAREKRSNVLIKVLQRVKYNNKIDILIKRKMKKYVKNEKRI